MTRRAACMRGLVAAVLMASVLLLGGCVYSETITEVIYNNEETSQVDSDIAPILVNTVTASETTEELPKLDDSDADTATTTENVKPFFTLDESVATTDEPAPRPVYAQEAEAAGQTARQARPEEDTPTQQDSEQTEDESDQGSQADESTDGQESPDVEPSDDAADDGGGEGEGEGEGTDSGEEPGGGDDPTEPEEPGHAGAGTVYTSDVDKEPDIPEGISKVAAIGNYAVIVSMVSGTAESTALVACDETTKEEASSLLANRGIALVPALWSGDGGSADSMTAGNLDQLVTVAQPDLVFLEEGSKALSEDQISELQANDIDIYYLPSLSSAKRIRFAVRVVGMILAKGGVEGAEAAYTGYLDFEERMVAKYADSGHNGGIAGGYDLDADRGAPAAPEGMATLFIDKWDADARHVSNLVDSSSGVAVATLGYRTAPVSYYMSVGGALNNAASRPFRYLAGSGVVWQFAQNELGYRFGSWSNLDIATYDLCEHVSGGVYISDLLWNESEIKAGYGTEGFPAVVAKSQDLKERMEANTRSPGQLYYAYPVIHPADGTGTTMGFFKNGNEDGAFVESSIGRVGNESPTAAASPECCQVLVNPKSLCQADASDSLCSWTDGSIESVLEASWVYWKFHDGSEAEFRQDVIDFYSTFYEYDVTGHLDTMIAGPVS